MPPMSGSYAYSAGGGDCVAVAEPGWTARARLPVSPRRVTCFISCGRLDLEEDGGPAAVAAPTCGLKVRSGDGIYFATAVSAHSGSSQGAEATPISGSCAAQFLGLVQRWEAEPESSSCSECVRYPASARATDCLISALWVAAAARCRGGAPVAEAREAQDDVAYWAESTSSGC